MVSASLNTVPAPRHSSGWRSVFGSWEFGLLLFMAALYLIGVWVNPRFFGDAGALASILRDASRFGVIAVGMTFVIVNKDLDLSVGSTVALTSAVFSLMFAPNFMDLGPWVSLLGALAVGVTIGLVNGVLVTFLRVPAFIATLTMLFIGRGMVLGLTKGRNIGYAEKAADYGLFGLGDTNVLGFSNHIIIFAIIAVLGGIVLARTRWGYETYATGGNLRAAAYAGINTHWVRIRGFLLSSLCATMAGLMVVTQSKGITSQDGFGAELIVIASVIVGGASILGGRGRVLGSVLGATLVVLIDKVLREGIPTTRLIKIGDQMIEVQAMAQMPPGAVPAFLGLILVAAVLIEPWVIRRKLIGRMVARLRGRPPPVVAAETVAIESAGTGGSTLASSELHARGLRKLLTYRETMAIGFMVVLWLVGMWLRPDFWGSLDNSFNLLLAFTEIGLMAVGMAFVIGNADIDLSVGAVLALSGSTAAFVMKKLGGDPATAVTIAFLVGTLAGALNGFLATKARLPAFVATLGMFYMARGIAAWLVGGRQLSQFPESFNLLGRKLIELLKVWDLAPAPDSLLAQIASAMSTQTLILFVLAVIFGLVLWRMPFGYMVKATGGNRRAADYAGINTDRVRFLSLVFCAMMASLAGLVNIAFFRSFNPQAGVLRELDVIASVIIGGGSIFGGFASVLGALAGAAVITLVRALLSLQVFLPDGRSFVMPQNWVNVSIGFILIVAVLADIWLRQERLLLRIKTRLARGQSP
jgi:ribose transport system permease protein